MIARDIRLVQDALVETTVACRVVQGLLRRYQPIPPSEAKGAATIGRGIYRSTSVDAPETFNTGNSDPYKPRISY